MRLSHTFPIGPRRNSGSNRHAEPRSELDLAAGSVTEPNAEHHTAESESESESDTRTLS
jgi:hypothetical protein